MAAGGLVVAGGALLLYCRGGVSPGDALFEEAMGAFRLAKEKGSDTRPAGLILQRAADLGSAAAQRTLGWHYRHGIGVKRDYKEAARWYEQAVAQGDAQVCVSRMPWPRSTPRRTNTGTDGATHPWQAKYELGVLYMSGLGVGYNPKAPQSPSETRSLIADP